MFDRFDDNNVVLVETVDGQRWVGTFIAGPDKANQHELWLGSPTRLTEDGKLLEHHADWILLVNGESIRRLFVIPRMDIGEDVGLLPPTRHSAT